ncbi:DUF2510 domain-containing protein [Nocardia sp. alder85J]|uniref:DUF2510 domain-containing protein n=1 Tax=Nocardia sp. alder85J TaxID=2862949 RepID=UPI001CD4C676|nr:DUF2510 domain-containing protein [Nocardia sp. alder85J]MCX4092348.1 DUF2510 domain-containing protein [Nocardia sp. alder85J]
MDVQESQGGTREQFMAAGWYIDPAEPSVQRRWDGYGWTADIAPAPPQAPVVEGGGDLAGAMNRLWRFNTSSLSALLVCVVYLVLESYTNIVMLGLIPISLSVQAVRRREPLCIAAAAGSVIFLVAPFLLFRH